jgi:HPt (histidine-containing phosphotransfer) domain-containing protein
MSDTGPDTNIETEIEALRAAVEAVDAAATADAAHGISGSAGLFGYPDLAAAAESLEEAALKARKGDAAAVTRLAPLAEAVYARAADVPIS